MATPVPPPSPRHLRLLRLLLSGLVLGAALRGTAAGRPGERERSAQAAGHRRAAIAGRGSRCAAPPPPPPSPAGPAGPARARRGKQPPVAEGPRRMGLSRVPGVNPKFTRRWPLSDAGAFLSRGLCARARAGWPPSARFCGAHLGLRGRGPGPGCPATGICPGVGVAVLVCLSPCLGRCWARARLCCRGGV